MDQTERTIPKMGAPASRAFEQAGIKSVSDFKKWTEKDLLKLHGVGQKAIRILKQNGIKLKQ